MGVDTIPQPNSIIFVWLNNYAGVLLKTPSKTLLIDPVDVRPKSFPQVDVLLITHEHYDHLDQRLIEEIQKNTDCRVIADRTSTKKLSQHIPAEKLLETQPGEETRIGEVKIKTETCNHPAATPVTYIITSEDNMKIWHTADSLPFPEMALIGKNEELDVVFCTVGIAPGTSPKTGSEIAWLTKPKVAVPYHSSAPENQKKFVQILKTELPKTTCFVPEVNKIYQVTKGEKSK